MTDLIAKFLRDVTAPVGSALFRAIIALALVVVALGALSSALVVANVWLYAWLATMVTHVQALAIVAGAWVVIAIVALLSAWIVLRRSKSALSERPVARGGTASAASVASAAMPGSGAEAVRRPISEAADAPPLEGLANQIDAMVDPLAKTLTALGLTSETTALVSGAQAFKTLKTSQLSALALIVGYAAARSFERKK